ncbi:cytochrome b5 [Plenodomus tracheiphilus IPT5]|uniref:Cytochrome b5 n=1 Tax=Plenodomus tracheiphilus IPT5 TaxID=1408161 RepID=A0A6A7AS48_9PLEO|nr:cytochrome b5 [Plenodomus tracheiphilus IPT5]
MATATPPRYRRTTQDPTTDLKTSSIPPTTASSPAAQQKAELQAAVKEQAVKTSNGVSVLDILRVLGGILLLSSGLSYLSTSGESMTWGYNAWWTRAREWKKLVTPQVSLTDTQLATFNGADPTKPIYLALNGTIYDVSSSPSTYGPGGSYHVFAGKDAARAFITGCFAEDAVPDLRGVEWTYMPIDPEEKDSATPDDIAKAKTRKQLTSAERKNRQAQELRAARKQVREGLENWHKLFRGDKGKPYFKVGEVRREEGWLERLPKRELCEQARKARPVRKYE